LLFNKWVKEILVLTRRCNTITGKRIKPATLNTNDSWYSIEHSKHVKQVPFFIYSLLSIHTSVVTGGWKLCSLIREWTRSMQITFCSYTNCATSLLTHSFTIKKTQLRFKSLKFKFEFHTQINRCSFNRKICKTN
jgi:hypothetical protein